MLLIVGKILDVTTRTVRPTNSAEFTVREVALLASKSRVERIELAKDFRGETPNEGDEVALQVSVKSFPMKGERAGYSLTAWENMSDVVQIATAARL